MALTPHTVKTYHVFLASPGDVSMERQQVRKFFDQYNRDTAHQWGVRFEVIDWENYSTAGVGRPQELITEQTLEKYKDSLALVIGIMAQRFGSPSGEAESGTQEEFEWAMKSNKDNAGWPEIKWFFRSKKHFKIVATEPDEIQEAAVQWTKVLHFREKMQNLNNPLFFTEYDCAEGFSEVLAKDLRLWLNDSSRPWADNAAAKTIQQASTDVPTLPVLNYDQYRTALLTRFDKLNFEMLDTTGANYNEVRLWSVFVPQSARECHEYNPRLLELPKEHQLRLLDCTAESEEELENVISQAEQLQQDYFSKPISPILDLVDNALRPDASHNKNKLVILGDPGSGKSSLIRYLALRWATNEYAINQTPVPLVIELGRYGRWQCQGKKDFLRFLEEAPDCYDWSKEVLENLVKQSGTVFLLLDGLDEVFDPKLRKQVLDDIQRLSSQYPHIPIIVTSRVVGYQAQALKDAEFQHYMLQDLDEEQVTTFITNWHKETFSDIDLATPKKDRLLKAIKESKSIAMLAGNPLLLTMMAILNRHQELPRDRADLYAQASRVLLHQWDTERALQDFPGISAEVSYREKTEILRLVASHMQQGPDGLKGNIIEGDKLTQLIENYLRTELRIEQSRAAARALVEQLRQRNFILCFVGADSYAFVHRTLLEYFCATDIVHQFNKVQSLSEQELVAFFTEHCTDDGWREVLRLICSQIDERFVVNIVEQLLAVANVENWDGASYIPELVLAAWCISEVRNTKRYERLTTSLFQSIIVIGFAGRYRGFATEEFADELTRAAREVIWPNRHHLKEKLISATKELNEFTIGESFYPSLFATISKEPNEMKPLLNYWNGDNANEIRAYTLTEIADKWPIESSRRLLEAHTKPHITSIEQINAIHGLSAHWPDKDTRKILEDIAMNTQDENVRFKASSSLARNWQDKKSRQLLEEFLKNTKGDLMIYVASGLLAELYPTQTTLDLLLLKVSTMSPDAHFIEGTQKVVEKLRKKLEQQNPH